MTTAGSEGTGGVRRLRALTAVVALYALVLQAVLGGIAALPVASPLALDVHCLQQGGEEGGAGPGAPHAPAHHHACCTAAQPAAGPPPPLPATASIAWPPRPALRLIWRREAAAAPRAPPNTLASARAPPVV